jgi:acyl-CoA synthetase (NDP forming)
VTSPELKAFFEPKSVVLLGASELSGEGATSAAFFRSLAYNISKFKSGKVYGVDLSGKLEKYEKKLTKVPKGLDLAIVLLPKDLLKKNLSILLAKRTKALVLISGELEPKQKEELGNLAKKGKLLLLGPNATMGIINTGNGLAAVPDQGLAPKQGNLAVISQDGGLAAAMLDWVCFRGVGISKFACIGDGLGVDVAELVRYLAQDKKTKVVGVYLETVGEGRKLVGAISEATKVKPVVVLKGGSEDEKIFEAALKQAGALQVRGIEEFFAVAEGLAKQPHMRGNRVAVVTNVSGHARLLLKSLVKEGLVPAELSAETTKKILNKYPHVSVFGFVDLGIGAKADIYKFVGEQLLSDKAIDSVVVVNAIKSTLLELKDVRDISSIARKSREKPVIDLAPGGEDNLRVREVLADTELPIYDQPEKAARVMKLLGMRGKILDKVEKRPSVLDD